MRDARDDADPVFHDVKEHFYSMLRIGDKPALVVIALVDAAFVVAAAVRVLRR